MLKNRKPEGVMDLENLLMMEGKTEINSGRLGRIGMPSNIVTTIPDHEDLFLWFGGGG